MSTLTAPIASTPTLDQLRPGQSGRIVAVDGSVETRHRLLEMGLTRGTTVRVVRLAPFGDPMEVHIRGYRLSVRRSEAAAVRIEGGG